MWSKGSRPSPLRQRNRAAEERLTSAQSVNRVVWLPSSVLCPASHQVSLSFRDWWAAGDTRPSLMQALKPGGDEEAPPRGVAGGRAFSITRVVDPAPTSRKKLRSGSLS